MSPSHQTGSEIRAGRGGQDAIVVTERQHATGARGGIETIMIFYAIWRFRDGRVVEVRWEDDRDKALKRVRLRYSR